jgi:hypothetical protein
MYNMVIELTGALAPFSYIVINTLLANVLAGSVCPQFLVNF